MDIMCEMVVLGYFLEKECMFYIKCDVVDILNFLCVKLVEGMNMMVICEFKNGKIYVLIGVYLVGDLIMFGDDVKVGFEFYGIKGIW